MSTGTDIIPVPASGANSVIRPDDIEQKQHENNGEIKPPVPMVSVSFMSPGNSRFCENPGGQKHQKSRQCGMQKIKVHTEVPCMMCGSEYRNLSVPVS